ncbi:MAG: MFS transporter [Thermoguttaceae bacterium]
MMSENVDSEPTILERRRARRLAVWNGAIWSIGNGLVGTTLIVYWAKELHAAWIGLSIGLVAAAPQVVGVLRLGAPAMIARLADRKRFCIWAFLLSVVPLALIPLLCKPGLLPSPTWSLATLILLWCVYQLLQYLAAVALWSWLADAARTRIRGRFLGWRQRWVMAGMTVATVIAGMAVINVQDINPSMREVNPAYPKWVVYGFVVCLGAIFLLAAIVPLAQMPACRRRPSATSASARPVANLTSPFRDRRFLRLLVYGCWFSLFNGITDAAQNSYVMNVLGLSFFRSLSLKTGMNLGQWVASPWAGRWGDRFGNRSVMVVSQLLVAAALLFFAVASRAHWWWLVGAYVLWIAYAGINVCRPALMLKLAPPELNTSYVAVFDTVSGLCFAASAVLGGVILDACARWSGVTVAGVSFSFFPLIFIFGWIVRSLGALLLLWIVEPAERELEASDR